MPGTHEPQQRQVESTTLDEADEHTVAQQNVGRQRSIGGGEWPDPDTPPRGPAPGTTTLSDGGDAADDADG